MSSFYVIKEGLSGFRRTKLASLGSIITITISLLLLGIFYIISTNTSRIVENIREKVEMEAFLAEPVSQQKVMELQRQLLAIRGVEEVQYISKIEAARIFKREFGEEINTVLEFNPLPPSFKIFLLDEYRTTTKADEIIKAIKKIRGVEDVIYRRELLELIEKHARLLYNLGLGLGILIGISAIFLVSNTIRLTIYAKRKSVQTMKLVGASRWFVRAPFLVEGIIQGLIGGLVAASIIYYLLTFVAGFLSADLAEFIYIENSFYVFVIALGVFLGLFGSSISVRRFISETVAN